MGRSQHPAYRGRVDVAEARDRFAAARVARLATVRPDGRPHLVPVVLAVQGDTVWSAVDGKPKSSRPLARLANIAAEPRVTLLVDHYEDDWARLWWVRADGLARVVPDDSSEASAARAALRTKYEQYQQVSLDGPVIAVTVQHWSTWTA